MIGRTNAGGGGGIGESIFTIIGGTERPDNAKDNTIWVNTDREITSHAFSSIEPENPDEGMLWVTIADTSSVKVGAPVGNDLIVLYLNGVKQYTGGEWANKEYSLFTDGVWNDFATNLYIIANGIAQMDLTAEYLNLTEKEGGLTIAGVSNGYFELFAENVDLSAWNKIVVAGTFNLADYAVAYTLAAWDSDVSDPTYSNSTATEKLTTTGATLDVSGLSGKYSVGITTLGKRQQTIVDLYLC